MCLSISENIPISYLIIISYRGRNSTKSILEQLYDQKIHKETTYFRNLPVHCDNMDKYREKTRTKSGIFYSKFFLEIVRNY